MSQTESVLVEVPASTEISASGEEVITLDLDVAGLNGNVEEEVRPIPLRQSTSRRAQK